MRAADLAHVMRAFNAQVDSRILVGTAGQDDAAVYLENDELAHVATTDFFNAIVDDPFVFGAIAATNALSDIYAMGATPRFALNLVGFPIRTADRAMLENILAGGLSKASEAGIPIIGGHSIELAEPLYGLAVHGVVHPQRIIRNRGARPGDRLILTKPLGSGAVIAGIRRGEVEKALESTACRVMLQLNRTASEAMRAVGVHAATDVTGFGLLGHLKEMVEGSDVTALLAADRIPVIAGVRELIARKVYPRATTANLEFVKGRTTFHPEISAIDQLLLADAQTSGGLLIAVPEAKTPTLVSALTAAGCLGAVIGRITDQPEAGIVVKPAITAL